MAILDTMAVHGLIVDAYGCPAEGIKCIFSVTYPPVCCDDIAILATQVTVETDSSGEFTADLIKSTVYKVNISDTGFIRAFTVPEDGTSINLFELIGC